MQYIFTKYADRELSKFPEDIQRRIIQKLNFYIVQKNPIDFAEKIEVGAGKVYRFRVGEYRIIFDWKAEVILILRIGDRSEVYKK